MESVPVWKVREEEVEIFTPEEMSILLANAPDNLIPFLTIGGFAGLRSAGCSACRGFFGSISQGAARFILKSRRPCALRVGESSIPHRRPT